MKKLLMMLTLFFIPFCMVQAKNIEINKLTIEGETINLKEGIYEYDITLNTIYSNISVYAVVDEGITYEVTGNDEIQTGNNIITIDITDEQSTAKYTINVLKLADNVIELSSNNKLKNLSISGYPLGFNADKLEYNLTIGSESKLRINYRTESDKTEVYIDGNEDLVNGSVIRVKVIAQSGDVREYKINITATEVREEIEVFEEEEGYDSELIAYIVAALSVILFLFIANFVGKDEEKK